jgi:hypothetical protein
LLDGVVLEANIEELLPRMILYRAFISGAVGIQRQPAPSTTLVANVHQ